MQALRCLMRALHSEGRTARTHLAYGETPMKQTDQDFASRSAPGVSALPRHGVVVQWTPDYEQDPRPRHQFLDDASQNEFWLTRASPADPSDQVLSMALDLEPYSGQRITIVGRFGASSDWIYNASIVG